MIRRPPRSTRTDTLFPYTTLFRSAVGGLALEPKFVAGDGIRIIGRRRSRRRPAGTTFGPPGRRSEEHTSELQSLMRISYAVFCLKKKTQKHNRTEATIHDKYYATTKQSRKDSKCWCESKSLQ